jgi:hypothetical protein
MAKPLPLYMTRKAVRLLCAKNGLGRPSAEVMFFQRASPARIVLQGRKTAVYITARVYEALGLQVS